MTHEECLERCVEGLVAALDAPTRSAVDAHLAGCAECRGEWKQMQAADAALRSWGDVPAPPAAPAPVPRPLAPRAVWPRMLAAGLVGLVLGAAGVSRFTPPPPLPPAPAPDTRSVYALFLEEPLVPDAPSYAQMRPGYVPWMDSLDAAGVFAGGARFDGSAGWFVAPGGAAMPLGELPAGTRHEATYSGFFLVRANSYAEAVEIARHSPHLDYGGILVRGRAAQ
ncbi:MAG: hypothetical protein KF709_09140 [Gemmatimonadaceae bacterium]|nr:hypothetical protein [Gemmatimonadaceae bacterium]